MSEADKMFEKLDYKMQKITNGFVYCNGIKKIIFDTLYRKIDILGSITLEELKAIIKKCEELGWI